MRVHVVKKYLSLALVFTSIPPCVIRLLRRLRHQHPFHQELLNHKYPMI